MMTSNEKKASVIVKGLVSYLKKCGDEGLLTDVSKVINKLVGEKDKVVVFSPTTLSLQQRRKAEKLVLNLVKRDKITVSFEVNKLILDGLQIKYRDNFWDLSLLGQINKLMEKRN